MLLLLLGAWSLPVKSEGERGGIDWIFVLDTSASMHGAGGTANIFGKIKETISDFIRSAREGDTVTLYTFDRDTTLRSHIRISGEIDKTDLLKTIADLSSEGDRTYTGKAIHDALGRALELKKRSDAGNRTVSIVLFTDGLEDVRGIANPISIPSNIALVPKDQPYIFFVSVGVRAHESQLESFIKHPAMEDRGEVIRDPGAGGIAQVGERIRKTVEKLPPPTPLNLVVNPANLDFGQIEPGESTSQTIRVGCNTDCRLRVALHSPETVGLTVTAPNDVVPLKAGEEQSLEIGLMAADEGSVGPHSFAVVLTAEPTNAHFTSTTLDVQAALNVVRTPLWRTVLSYSLLFLLLIAIALVIISVIKGEPPWVWFPALFSGASLEGELQVIQPRPARVEDEFISLTQLRTQKVALSSLIANGAMEDSDAELEAIKRNGKLNVNLHRLKGNVYVNKIEVANSRIYNDDIIELGGTKLLFNCLNLDRPIDSERLEGL